MTDKEHKHTDHNLPVQVEQPDHDSASKSLTSALRLSFNLLKIVMVVIAAVFLFSGIFTVGPDEQALVLNFGKISGSGEQRVLKPGLKFAWPAPISEIVKLPKREQALDIDSFWYSQSDAEKLNPAQARVPEKLNPMEDGYCLTRNENIDGSVGSDYNIVHAKWRLNYKIVSPVLFFKNVYYQAPKPGQDFNDVAKISVHPLLQAIAEDAIVTTMVNYSIDEALASSDRMPMEIARAIRGKLQQIDSGIGVESVQIVDITWPRQVAHAFEMSNRASQTKRKVITDARSLAEKVVSEAGGVNAEQNLLELKKSGLTEQQKDVLLDGLAGKSKEMLAQAKADKTGTIETAMANAEYFKALLPEYKKRPELVLQKIYQNAVDIVMENADEKIFIQPSDGKEREVRVQLNRDPVIPKKKAKKTN